MDVGCCKLLMKKSVIVFIVIDVDQCLFPFIVLLIIYVCVRESGAKGQVDGRLDELRTLSIKSGERDRREET